VKNKLTEILLKNNLLTQKQLDEALKLQSKKGGRLSQILVDENYISDRDLAFSLGEELGIPPINLNKLKINPEVTSIIKRESAVKYEIMPISKVGNTLTVAMANPFDIYTIDDIKSLTNMDISPIITTRQDILDAINSHYDEKTHEEIEKIVEGFEHPDLEMMGNESPSEDMSKDNIMQLVNDTPVVKVTDYILAQAVKLRSSDVLIEPEEKKMRIRYRIDGVLQEVDSPPKVMNQAIISRIKVMSELDIAEHRLPQDGRFRVKIEGRLIDFRVSILPSSFGEKIALRVLDKSQAMLELKDLGFRDKTLSDIEEAAKRPHGMILVCGPTGCGKTTTLYSILHKVDAPDKNLITVEDPVEYELKGINQVTIRPQVGLTFQSSLRSILRQDPDVIMIGEIRDYDTMDIAIKAALTGHLVLSTLHTNDAPSSIVRMINMGVEPFLITSSVILVAAQRLVRRICPKCKEEEKLSDHVLTNLDRSSLDATDSKHAKIYKGQGCDHCQHTGYRGRMSLIETLVISPKVREMIISRAQEFEIKHQAREEGMRTLREDGLAKVFTGETTLEEVLRITAPD